jgi:PAS domain S-box-containing protein
MGLAFEPPKVLTEKHQYSPRDRGVTQPNIEPISSEPTRADAATPLQPHGGHIVQFYENEEFLSAAVADFLAEGLERGESVVVIATEEHRAAFVRRLGAKGIDVPKALRMGQFTMLDAAETLRMFMVGDKPDGKRFRDVIGAVLDSCRRRDRLAPVRFFGEMVDQLWKAGNTDGAIQLEDLWNELNATNSFTLLCAYAMGNFYKEIDAKKYRHVCSQHSKVIPSPGREIEEVKAALGVSELEERARSLESEVAFRTEMERRFREALKAAQRAEEQLRINERELTDFFENAPLALNWVGPDGVILRANQAELDLLGYTREEYVGHKVGEFHVDSEAIKAVFDRLSRGETVRSFESQMKCKDGGTKEVVIDANVRWGSTGEFAHTRCFTRDVTDGNRTAELRARLAAIVSSSDDAIVSKTLDGIIQSWNRGAEQIFGYTAAEAIGKHISLIIPQARLSEEDYVIGRLRRGEKIDHFETVRIAKDGREIDVSLTVSPVIDGNGRIIGASKVARDITETVRSRKELQAVLNDAIEAKKSADAANRAKAEFLAAMSHELRTPLNAISGYVQLMLMGVHGPVNSVQQDALLRVEKSQAHLLSLINDVLNFAKVEAGKVNYDVEDVILADAIAEVGQMMEPQFATKQQRYQASIDTRTVVRADQEKLRQILLNLLSNAAKFTPAGGQIILQTRSRKGRGNHRIEVVVSDTGPGIPEDKRDKVFDPFVQVHRGLSDRMGGVGLGLAISRDLARGMGGDLGLEDAPVGARFVLTLPSR